MTESLQELARQLEAGLLELQVKAQSGVARVYFDWARAMLPRLRYFMEKGVASEKEHKEHRCQSTKD